MTFYQHHSAKSDAVTHSNRYSKLLIQTPPAIHWIQTPSYVKAFLKPHLKNQGWPLCHIKMEHHPPALLLPCA